MGLFCVLECTIIKVDYFLSTMTCNPCSEETSIGPLFQQAPYFTPNYNINTRTGGSIV